MDEGGDFQGKSDLRIGVEIRAAALAMIAGAGDDVAGRTIAEVGRALRWPVRHRGGNVEAWPGGPPARDAQGFEEAFGHRIGLAAGQPPRPWRRVEALD